MEERVDVIHEEFNARRKRKDPKQADRDNLDELKRLGDNIKKG